MAWNFSFVERNYVSWNCWQFFSRCFEIWYTKSTIYSTKLDLHNFYHHYQTKKNANLNKNWNWNSLILYLWHGLNSTIIPKFWKIGFFLLRITWVNTTYLQLIYEKYFSHCFKFVSKYDNLSNLESRYICKHCCETVCSKPVYIINQYYTIFRSWYK